MEDSRFHCSCMINTSAGASATHSPNLGWTAKAVTTHVVMVSGVFTGTYLMPPFLVHNTSSGYY